MTHHEILVINSGSSSIKFAAFHCDAGIEKSLSGTVENIHTAPNIKIKDANNNTVLNEDFETAKPYDFFFDRIFQFLKEQDYQLQACGHRVVHGGTDYHQPILIDRAVINDLKKLIPYAPLHQPYNLEAIEIIAAKYPDIPQIACFDTAFHWTNPQVVTQFGIPNAWYQKGIKRYGFHGLSYEFILSEIQKSYPEYKNSRILVAHLGNGASLCAINKGKSYATTMGFSTLDGLLMGTRCGRIDPGVLLYLMEFKKMDLSSLQTLLYKESGLLGVSGGFSADMRDLLEAASTNPLAQQAIDLFVHQIQREMGALIALLEGIDLIVFTGGIGEKSSVIRARVIEHFKWLGITLGSGLNQQNEPVISTNASRTPVFVIPTNEEWVIANHTQSLL